MKKLALIPTIISISTAGGFAQQSELDILRERTNVQEQRITQLEKEISQLKASFSFKEAPKAVLAEDVTPSSVTEYTVQKGDTLSKIAREHKTSVSAIKAANQLTSDSIGIGQKLKISGKQPITSQARQEAAPKPEIKHSRAVSAKHTVKSGETFYAIARLHGTSVQALMDANPKVSATNLRVGQTLQVTHSATASNRPAQKKQQSIAKHAPAKKKQSVAKKPAPQPDPVAETAIRTVTVNKQVSYGQFASRYGASTSQLNALNGLNLNKNTMLAIGSELYVPKK